MSDVAPIAPMEARLVSALPDAPGWQFEPKWDGFRAIIVRDGARIALWSKAGKRLERYFPELVDAVAGCRERRFILDGEIILPKGGSLSFDALQQRLHPAPSRIAKLSVATPAQLMLFDCLASGPDQLADQPLTARRRALEAFHARASSASLLLSHKSEKRAAAQAWLAQSGGALDGVVAKRLDQPYQSGKRAMLKVKVHRSADCVVGGLRRAEDGRIVSLLLGLYDDTGLLHHVGFTAAIRAEDHSALERRIRPHRDGAGFDGKSPDGPSRWSAGRDRHWEPLTPALVVEVAYDQVTGDRFRHGTRILRWRPDKAPRQCGMEQLVREASPADLAAIDQAV
ncbi:ATP-dependent DNA ligase [Sphingomonas crocodyli]|uniref:DNA ligase (ATP) n=1 Tax=Sphingomonas crocodyli TaxID=1979270 RepID=A0A437LY63_9SPHN|nr:ATP-dependent DNA ligase [Sphingomonas crocodyli]RVT90369.1 ATP-dependent DNA ligase [Sphingomonas crocodyli]